MKLATNLLLSAAVLGIIAASATSALAQAGGPVITVDENGNMTINGNPGARGVIGVDPISNLQGLVYQLPFPGAAGDIELLDPDQTGPNRYSDVIRFLGNGQMFFFSDIEDEAPPYDLADVPQMPVVFQPNTLVFQEQGVEGNNGLFGYIPGAGGPGGDISNPTYNFISDIPEPSSFLLAGLGGGLLLLLALRGRSLSQTCF